MPDFYDRMEHQRWLAHFAGNRADDRVEQKRHIVVYDRDQANGTAIAHHAAILINNGHAFALAVLFDRLERRLGCQVE